MPCYQPLKGWRARNETENGKRRIVFDKGAGFADMEIQVPCGQCVGCRLERSRQWACRCMFEASLHEDNCFITLTYDEENLPSDQSLSVKTFQDFMKRLREKFPNKKIRYYHCGEYGEVTGRPHYHAVLFGFNFPDLEFWKVTESGHKLYNSAILRKVWKHGHANVGSVTFDSCAYVARYVMKKITGQYEKAVQDWYNGMTFKEVCKKYKYKAKKLKEVIEHRVFLQKKTGELILRKPEYTTMSRRPGIGKQWYDSFKDDVYPHDYVVINGVRCKPPKYFDALYEVDAPDEFKKVKALRSDVDEARRLDNDSFRLPIKEKVKLDQIKNLQRRLDQ